MTCLILGAQILDDFDVSWEGFVSQMPSIAHLLERDQAKAGESAATDPGAMGVPANLSAKHPVIIVPGMLFHRVLTTA